MTKRFKVVTMGSMMAAALAAAAPGWALDRADPNSIGTPMQTLIPEESVPSGTVVVQPVAPGVAVVEPSASAGSSGVVTQLAPYGHYVSGAAVPIDRTIRLGPNTRSVNVDWGQTVNFIVPDANGSAQEFAWKFDGTANKVNLAQLSPPMPGAPDVSVYVNQTKNPLRNGEDYSTFPPT